MIFSQIYFVVQRFSFAFIASGVFFSFVRRFANPAHGVHVYDKSNDNFDLFNFVVYVVLVAVPLSVAHEHSLL